MTRCIGALLLAMAAMMPAQQASAQNALGGAIVGGAAGALIGGAATGRAGGAIAGGVVGASIGAQAERRNNYYWYNGRCYAAVQGGYVLVKRAYCY
jgi:outer membrane lipoprotein SlyB